MRDGSCEDLFLIPRPAGVGTCLPRVFFNLVSLNCQEALWDTELSLGACWQSPPVFFHQDKKKMLYPKCFGKVFKSKSKTQQMMLWYYSTHYFIIIYLSYFSWKKLINVSHGFLHLFCATVPLRPFWLWCHNLYLVIINIGPTTEISLGRCYLLNNQWQIVQETCLKTVIIFVVLIGDGNIADITDF